MVKIKIWALIITLFLIFPYLFGCAPKAPQADYRQLPFSAKAILSDGTIELYVKILSKKGDTDSISMELLSPDSLSGITFCISGNEKYALCGDMRLSPEGYGYIFGWLELIFPEGELTSTGECKINGRYAIGLIDETKSLEVYVDKDTYAPIFIASGNMKILIESFEFTS